MRRSIEITLAFALGAGCIALPRAGYAKPEHEAYTTGGGVLVSTPRRLMAGVGFGVGYRLRLAPQVAIFADATLAGYLGYLGTASLGVHVEPRGNRDGWAPAIEVGGSVFVGDRLAILTNDMPSIPSPVAWGAFGRIAPIRFRSASWTAAVLVVAAGTALEQGAAGYFIDIRLLEVGYRF